MSTIVELTDEEQKVIGKVISGTLASSNVLAQVMDYKISQGVAIEGDTINDII